MALDLIGTTTATDRRGSESWNKANNTDIFNTFAQISLGGSRSIAIPTGGGYQDAPEYEEFIVPNNSKYTGGAWTALVEVRTENAATTITPKIRNVTDATDAVVGSAGTSTAWGTYQSLTFTPAAGKTYRLMASKSDDAFQGWVKGFLRRTEA